MWYDCYYCNNFSAAIVLLLTKKGVRPMRFGSPKLSARLCTTVTAVVFAAPTRRAQAAAAGASIPVASLLLPLQFVCNEQKKMQPLWKLEYGKLSLTEMILDVASSLLMHNNGLQF